MKLRDTIGSGDISSSWEHRGGSGELLAQWSALEPVPRRANVHGRESAPSRQQERNSTRGCSNASRRCRPLPQQLPAPQEMLRILDVTENVSEQDEGAVASRGRESAHVKRCPTRQKTRKSESDRHSLGEDEAMVRYYAPQCTVTALEPYGDGQLSSGGADRSRVTTLGIRGADCWHDHGERAHALDKEKGSRHLPGGRDCYSLTTYRDSDTRRAVTRSSSPNSVTNSSAAASAHAGSVGSRASTHDTLSIPDFTGAYSPVTSPLSVYCHYRYHVYWSTFTPQSTRRSFLETINKQHDHRRTYSDVAAPLAVYHHYRYYVLHITVSMYCTYSPVTSSLSVDHH